MLKKLIASSAFIMLSGCDITIIPDDSYFICNLSDPTCFTKQRILDLQPAWVKVADYGIDNCGFNFTLTCNRLITTCDHRNYGCLVDITGVQSASNLLAELDNICDHIDGTRFISMTVDGENPPHCAQALELRGYL